MVRSSAPSPASKVDLGKVLNLHGPSFHPKREDDGDPGSRNVLNFIESTHKKAENKNQHVLLK